eukprot:TRINITY_DN16556_c0_g1_i1.p1 TRINITY_DN16556_c0_g1~~TRINITY_DN16556_c0_g1_i1.p1  ORF type:complete len:613 (+),score=223.77 TRINITY_DN16556_c0_g1_i1:44-1882(+)
MWKKPIGKYQTQPLKNKDAKALKKVIGDGLIDAKEDVTLWKLDTRLHVYAWGNAPMYVDTSGKLQGQLIPTVYALWRKPDILPPLYVNAEVSPYILNGADLMWPGVFDPAFTPVIKGQLVAITAVGNPMPFAVGTITVDAKMKPAKGKAVDILHYYGDFLSKEAKVAAPEGFGSERITKVVELPAEVVDTPPRSAKEVDSEDDEELYHEVENILLADVIDNCSDDEIPDEEGEGEGEGKAEEEEEEDSDYGPTLDVPVQGAEGIHEIESDDESEIEDLQIKSDDLVFMCTHQRQTGNSALEIYVYDDEQDNIYLHHDITLPAIPLSVAWSSHGRGKDGAAMEDGSFAAVTTFLPFIEVWDLNILDAPDPTVTLGGCKRASDNYRAKTLTPSMLMKSSHKDAVLTAKWNTEVQKVLASGSADCTVKLWDLVTGDNLHTFKQHEAPVQCLHWFKQQPQSLLSGGFDQCAKVVDCRTQKTQCSISLGGAPEAIVVSPFEENRIWITLEDGSLQQYDLRSTGAPMWSIKAHESEATIAVNPGINGLVATAGADRHVKLWDVRGDAPANLASRDLGQGRVFSLQFSADKPTYLLGSGDEGKPLVYCVTDDVSSAFKA